MYVHTDTFFLYLVRLVQIRFVIIILVSKIMINFEIIYL